MFRCVTLRELSHVMPFCRFCHFSIYNSVRFVYISVTFFLICFFLSFLAEIHAMPFLPCHSCHLWHLIDFKQFFLAKTLAKTCQPCHQNAKLLILKGFFIVKCVMSLFYNALSQIIITMLLYITLAIIRLPLSACHYPLAIIRLPLSACLEQCYYI